MPNKLYWGGRGYNITVNIYHGNVQILLQSNGWTWSRRDSSWRLWNHLVQWEWSENGAQGGGAQVQEVGLGYVDQVILKKTCSNRLSFFCISILTEKTSDVCSIVVYVSLFFLSLSIFPSCMWSIKASSLKKNTAISHLN